MTEEVTVVVSKLAGPPASGVYVTVAAKVVPRLKVTEVEQVMASYLCRVWKGGGISRASH